MTGNLTFSDNNTHGIGEVM